MTIRQRVMKYFTNTWNKPAKLNSSTYKNKSSQAFTIIKTHITRLPHCGLRLIQSRRRKLVEGFDGDDGSNTNNVCAVQFGKKKCLTWGCRRCSWGRTEKRLEAGDAQLAHSPHHHVCVNVGVCVRALASGLWDKNTMLAGGHSDCSPLWRSARLLQPVNMRSKDKK